MSGFVLGECKRRDGRTAWIIKFHDESREPEMDAVHADMVTGNVYVWRHFSDGSGTTMISRPDDLMPNAPDPLAEARAAIRKWMAGAAAPTHRANIGRDVWPLIEMLAQEPDE